MTNRKPIVAIVGRQNVGKSTLLNRLAGKRVSIVADVPGTTRDRVFAEVSWADRVFTLVDTGGLEMSARSTMAQAVREQVEVAVEEADVIIFLVNAQDGVTPGDREIANLLRPAGKPILVVANKADNPRLEAEAVEFFELGLDEPIPISAYHGRGVAELLDKIISLLKPPSPVEDKLAAIKVALVGRPGVGKSTLLNALLGQKRAIVTETPGTTRDATDTAVDFEGQNVILIDTAGVRRRGQVEVGVERYSVIRSLNAIERADIVLLLLDASAGVAAQDSHIGGYIQQAGKGAVLLVNKWDLAENKNQSDWDEHIRNLFKFMPYALVVYISAKTGEGIGQIMPLVLEIDRERRKQVSPDALNDVVQEALDAHNPSRKGGKQLKIFEASQTGVNPPHFTFSVNDGKLVHFSYQRYLENRLREAFGFSGTEIRLAFKTRRKA